MVPIWQNFWLSQKYVNCVADVYAHPRILKREDKRQMTSLHRHFHCFLKILIFIAGGNDSFVVKNKFRAFWCLICLCSWIRSYLPPGHGRTVTSSAVTRSLIQHHLLRLQSKAELTQKDIVVNKPASNKKCHINSFVINVNAIQMNCSVILINLLKFWPPNKSF